MDKIIKQFYKDLVKALPMDDATFRSMLYTADLLPGDLKAKIQAMQTSAEKAEHLLDHAINNDATNFAKLLEVMNSSDNTALKKLASNIQNEIDSPSLSNGATGQQHPGAAAPVATKFTFDTAISQITTNYVEITYLPINSMLRELLAKKVIQFREKEEIEVKPLQTSRMEHLLDGIIIPSLRTKVSIKYKRFLEVLEKSGNDSCTTMAKILGGSSHIPE